MMIEQAHSSGQIVAKNISVFTITAMTAYTHMLYSPYRWSHVHGDASAAGSQW